MAPLHANALPSPPSLHHHRSKSASETQRDEARVEFDKTIEGHYRHGKTGYRQVGALFLTWKDDDMQCRATEVGALRYRSGSQAHVRVIGGQIEGLIQDRIQIQDGVLRDSLRTLGYRTAKKSGRLLLRVR